MPPSLKASRSLRSLAIRSRDRSREAGVSKFFREHGREIRNFVFELGLGAARPRDFVADQGHELLARDPELLAVLRLSCEVSPEDAVIRRAFLAQPSERGLGE